VPEEVRLLPPEQALLTTLVVKVAVAATLATMLVRFGQFRRILLTEKRAWRERLTFAFAFGIPLSLGVSARLLLNYDAADLSLAGSYLAGLIAGPYAGAIVGSLVGLPALTAGEWIAIILAVGCGFAGGGLREVAPKEAIWHITPLLVTAFKRHVWTLFGRFRIDWQLTLLAAPISLELLRQALGFRYGIQRLFYLDPGGVWWLGGLVVLTSVLSVAVPIKIWNTARIEHRLQEQEKLLMTARVEALASQINPHFLFNTLTSISSLIRSHPETARMLIGKLSGLLRRLLRSQEHFVTLREELASIDEYLDIETIRFGPTLKVEKQIDPATLDQMVPSMLLQPLVENSIKHGISRKVGGGQITISSERTDGHTVIEVIDDGVGMTVESSTPGADGIGLRNVAERLRVIYGANYELQMSSTPGEGTCARIEIPELAVPQPVSA